MGYKNTLKEIFSNIIIMENYSIFNPKDKLSERKKDLILERELI